MQKGVPNKAAYKKPQISRFDGNPFIEALPTLPNTKLEFLTSLSNYPIIPTNETRRANEIVRMMELSTIGDIVFPFPEYQSAAYALASIMREAYVARSPRTSEDRGRRHAILSEGAISFPPNWKSSAKGYLMIAISGMGKTTFVRAFMQQYKQLINHTEYRRRPMKCTQIVYLVIEIPHDGTLRGLCYQFFNAIDQMLNTNYAQQADRIRNIAPMVQLLGKVATSVSLGLLVVDELQNLRAASAANAEVALNFFSRIIESYGISVLLVATPAVQSVLSGSVRNARKLASFGFTTIRPMKKNEELWKSFCDVLWDYTFVQNKAPLTKALRDAWWQVSAGNSAFASLVFLLAQRKEIGGREIIDELSFKRTAETEMAFLQPAVSALRTGKASALVKFDDLLFDQRYRELRKLLAVVESRELPRIDEFDEIPETPPRKAKRAKAASSSDLYDPLQVQIPMENPLERD